MSRLEKLLREMADEDLPTTDLGYKDEVPDEELKAMGESEDYEEMEEESDCDTMEESEDYEEMEEEADLPTTDLGYEDEVPDEELEAMVGDEEIRPESDEMDLGKDSAEIAEESEEDMEDKESMDEEEEEDMEKLVDEALAFINKRNRKFRSLREQEEDSEEMKMDEEEDMEDKESMDEEEDMEDKESMDEEEDMEDKESMDESFSRLFEGTKISKKFEKRAKTIFTAMVSEKLHTEKKKLREAYRLAAKYKKQKEENKLVEQVSNYLDYVVDEWIQENKVAIDSGLQTQIAEQFMQGLHGLFKRHYIEVPKSKKNLVEHLEKKAKLLESKLEKEVRNNVKMKQTLKKASKHLVLKEASEGLTESQAERLKVLSENIEFGSVSEFRQKVDILKESFTEPRGQKKTNSRMTKSGISLNESKKQSPEDAEVAAYLAAFKNSNL